VERLSGRRSELDRCSRCGKCLSVCPVYQVELLEPAAPRAKVQLIRSWLDGRLETTGRLRELFHLCLLCGACAQACPNGVRPHDLVLAARRAVVSRYGVPWLRRHVFRDLLPHAGRLHVAGRLLSLYRATGLHRLVQGTGLAAALPGPLGRALSLLPPAPGGCLGSASAPVQGPPRMRAAYFTGCFTAFVGPAVGRAAADVLTRNGIEVIIPPQSCCGIPAASFGDPASARRLARANAAALHATGADVVVVDCASCGSMLKDYPSLLNDPAAFWVAERVVDISTLLVDSGFATPPPLPLGRVTYHDPCHLSRGLGVRTAPRDLLRGIPGVKFVDMEDADTCCGAGGTFNLTHSRISDAVGRRKAEAIAATGASVVASSCPACDMQLRLACRRAQLDVEVVHVVCLLSQAYDRTLRLNRRSFGDS